MTDPQEEGGGEGTQVAFGEAKAPASRVGCFSIAPLGALRLRLPGLLLRTQVPALALPTHPEQALPLGSRQARSGWWALSLPASGVHADVHTAARTPNPGGQQPRQVDSEVRG